MALPKILTDLRNDERSYIINKMDLNPLGGVDSETYAKATQTAFVLAILEKVDSSKFLNAKTSIEQENISNRADFVTAMLDMIKTTQIGSSISVAYQGGLNSFKNIRRLGTNLILIDIEIESFPNDKTIFTTQDGLTYSLSGGSWSGGEELVVFAKGESLFVANSSNVSVVS